MPDTKTFLLIDAAGILYRSYFALPPLTSPSGVPSGALYGFIRSVLKVIHKIKPDLVAAVFDDLKIKNPGWRFFLPIKPIANQLQTSLSYKYKRQKIFAPYGGFQK